jgi:hypothetical protein
MEVPQAIYIPKQTPPKFAYALKGSTMKTLITSNPPLSQVTLVKGATVEFTVLLETDEPQGAETWEISLWYSRGDEWHESPLSPSANPAVSRITSSSTGLTSHCFYFKTKLEAVPILFFTIKFRSNPDQPWSWVNDHQRTTDGTIILEPKIARLKFEDLNDIIKDLNPIFKIRKVMSETPNTSVWSVTTQVEAANGDESTFADIKFGMPWSGNFIRYESSFYILV